MEFDIIQYLLIIILYLGLFRFLYANEGKIEGLVFILLFVLTLFVGFKIIFDFYKSSVSAVDKELYFLRFKSFEIFTKEIEILKLIKDFLLSPLVTLILLVLLIFSIVQYIQKGIRKDYDFLVTMCCLTFGQIGISFTSSDTKVPFYILFGIPIILLMVSLILIIVAIFNINSEAITKKLKLNKNGRERVKKYKDFFVSIIIFFIVTLFLFSVSPIYDKNNSVNENYKSSTDLLVTLFLLIIYGLSGYAVFEADAISKMERSETEGEKIKRLQIELKKRNQVLEIGKRSDINNLENIILADGSRLVVKNSDNELEIKNEEAMNRLLRKDEEIIKEILDKNDNIQREDIDKLIRIVTRTYVTYQ